MSSLNVHLQSIHQKISIKDEDREPYTKMYNKVRDWLLKEMKAADSTFNKLCKGTQLFGSYSNQVRIIKPSEFDVFIVLEFPLPMLVELLHGCPGFVRLDLEKAMKQLQNDPNCRYVHETFIELTKENKFLANNSLQSWIHAIIEKVVENKTLPGYSIKFTKCDVAQNLYVYEKSKPNKIISFDFVPAFKISGADKFKNLSRFSEFKDLQLGNFFVIPKSVPKRSGKARHIRKNGDMSFQVVNTKAETEILWDKQNLKVVYRLLKSLRDRYEMKRMKSYFLTTIFLWEVEKQDNDFWKKPISDLLMHMLQRLSDYFTKGSMPYYWITNFNLLTILKPNQVDGYAKTFTKLYLIFEAFSRQKNVSYDQIAAHFKLTSK